MSNEPIMEFRGDYAFLSNMWLCAFEYEGLIWNSSEAAYQAMKDGTGHYWRIVRDMTADDAKRYSRRIKIRKDWDDIKIRIMTDIVFCKFSQNDYLKIMLLDTGDRSIVESNRWGNQFWGVSNGLGKNHLGHILMYVRDILRHKKRITES